MHIQAIGAIIQWASTLSIVFSCCPLSLAFSLISLACTGSEMIQSKKPKIIEMVILGFSIWYLLVHVREVRHLRQPVPPYRVAGTVSTEDRIGSVFQVGHRVILSVIDDLFGVVTWLVAGDNTLQLSLAMGVVPDFLGIVTH